jgi:hypothetical protein
MCAIPRDDRYQESWATAYGCWGQPAKRQPQPAYVAGTGFGPTPVFGARPGFGAPGFEAPGFGAPGFEAPGFGAPGLERPVGEPPGKRPGARKGLSLRRKAQAEKGLRFPRNDRRGSRSFSDRDPAGVRHTHERVCRVSDSTLPEPAPEFIAMLRPRTRLEISRWAHSQALHYLARTREYRLSDKLRSQLIHVVAGYTGPCDEAMARAGLEWMREQARRKGERSR